MARPDHRPSKPLDAYPDAGPEIPAPPPEGAPGEALGQASSAVIPAPKPFEVAVLRFLDPAAISATVTLEFPFEWEGREVRQITIRRLVTAEVGAVMAAIPDGEDYDVHVFIAAMTGLPAPVLRGLIEDDGAEVIARARPLLPRKVVAALFSPITEPGEATPSPPPAG